MAHEIGNPLGAVIGYLNMLKEDVSGSERDLVERSLAEAERIDRLVRELLEYSSPIDRQTESFCPVSLLREVVEMLRHQGHFDDVQVDDICEDVSCKVSMDRSQLMQVFINLLLNARDAMQDQGHITLSTVLTADSISISVSDQGEGIDAETVNKVFEPFFTTKDPGKGYGLGLAVCQRIVDANGGSIAASSTAGQGACFTVTLPCLQTENKE